MTNVVKDGSIATSVVFLLSLSVVDTASLVVFEDELVDVTLMLAEVVRGTEIMTKDESTSSEGTLVVSGISVVASCSVSETVGLVVGGACEIKSVVSSGGVSLFVVVTISVV